MPAQSARSQIQSGRLFRRTYLNVPLKLVDAELTELAQDAVTENVSPLGARVVVNVPMQPDVHLYLKSPERRFRASVRVVYCEPLSDGQFGIGLEIQGPSINWTMTFTDSAA